MRERPPLSARVRDDHAEVRYCSDKAEVGVYSLVPGALGLKALTTGETTLVFH